MGEKTLDCLWLAAIPKPSMAAWDAWYQRICAKWSGKAVHAKMESLVARGYIECGVSARTGWLTDKGWQALEPYREKLALAAASAISQ